ncbi:MAG: tryptophan--tRNA ligase [Candidatus Moranbacteria bacterium]|nr:tryptophan--tRNA ligase [Candidatus Moranbacteria bacterium]
MKQRIFSGIQPSGNLHIGNYLGAVRQWVGLQDEYESIFCVVDMHAITVPQDPKELRQKTLEIAKTYLAAGIDPAKSSLFIQSHVPEHAELCWLLNTIAKNGDLTKMTQFKDKSGMDFDKFEEFLERIGGKEHIEGMMQRVIEDLPREQKDDLPEQIDKGEAINIIFRQGLITGFDRGVNIARKFFSENKEAFNSVGVGLFDYPVLMAADILLYDTAVVPVGDDQVQHIELTRTLARRFNDRFGETFRVPESRIMKEGARIMALDDPTKKMSKSATSGYNAIALTDDAETIRKKIKKAVTDSGSEIVYAEDKPALRNLINICTLLSGIPIPEIEAKYRGRGYGDFKADLAEVVVDFLTPFQERMNGYSDEETLRILREGADRVRPLAAAKLKEAKERVGFLI